MYFPWLSVVFVLFPLSALAALVNRTVTVGPGTVNLLGTGWNTNSYPPLGRPCGWWTTGPGDSAVFQFNGSALYVFGDVPGSPQSFNGSLDGSPLTLLPSAAGDPFCGEYMFRAEGLDQTKTHTFDAQFVGPNDLLALVSLIYTVEENITSGPSSTSETSTVSATTSSTPVASSSTSLSTTSTSTPITTTTTFSSSSTSSSSSSSPSPASTTITSEAIPISSTSTASSSSSFSVSSSDSASSGTSTGSETSISSTTSSVSSSTTSSGSSTLTTTSSSLSTTTDTSSTSPIPSSTSTSQASTASETSSTSSIPSSTSTSQASTASGTSSTSSTTQSTSAATTPPSSPASTTSASISTASDTSTPPSFTPSPIITPTLGPGISTASPSASISSSTTSVAVTVPIVLAPSSSTTSAGVTTTESPTDVVTAMPSPSASPSRIPTSIFSSHGLSLTRIPTPSLTTHQSATSSSPPLPSSTLSTNNTSSTNGVPLVRGVKSGTIAGSTVGAVVGALFVAGATYFASKSGLLTYVLSSTMFAAGAGAFGYYSRRLVFKRAANLPDTRIALFITLGNNHTTFGRGMLVWNVNTVNTAKNQFAVDLPCTPRTGSTRLFFATFEDRVSHVECLTCAESPAILENYEEGRWVNPTENVTNQSEASATNGTRVSTSITLGTGHDIEGGNPKVAPFLIIGASEFAPGNTYRSTEKLYLHAFRVKNDCREGQLGETINEAEQVFEDRMTPENGIEIDTLKPLTTWLVKQGKSEKLEVKVIANERKDIKKYNHDFKIEGSGLRTKKDSNNEYVQVTAGESV